MSTVSNRGRTRGWLWMLQKFGVRRTLWYWRQGNRRGWMTEEESRVFFERITGRKLP